MDKRTRHKQTDTQTCYTRTDARTPQTRLHGGGKWRLDSSSVSECKHSERAVSCTTIETPISQRVPPHILPQCTIHTPASQLSHASLPDEVAKKGTLELSLLWVRQWNRFGTIRQILDTKLSYFALSPAAKFGWRPYDVFNQISKMKIERRGHRMRQFDKDCIRNEYHSYILKSRTPCLKGHNKWKLSKLSHSLEREQL
jgi:hypothetical protein